MKPIPRRPLIPILTDVLEYRKIGGNTIDYTRKIVAKYGDVCECSFTGIKSYFIHDPDIIREFLVTQGPLMRRTYFFRAFRKFLGEGLFTSDGDLHKKQRRLMKPSFYPERVRSYGDIMVDCAREEAAKWKPGMEVNIEDAMARITLKVITRAMFGSGIGDDVIAGVRDNMTAVFRLMNLILQNPFYTYCLIHEIRIPVVRKFFAIRDRLDSVVNALITSRRKDGNSGKTDLLSLLMEARDEETGEGMSDRQIRDEVMTVFLAGHETTAVALGWTWYLLGKHPEVAENMYDEIKSVVGNRLPVAVDYPSLTYTRNVFRESLRLYPPAWTFARAAKEDVEIGGYRFPKGSVLWTLNYLLHHDARHFHDPEKFIPVRWQEEEIKSLHKFAYLPFGAGNRMCIGEGFAWMEGVLVLATIAGKCRLKLPAGFTAEMNPVFTLRMKNSLVMEVY